MMATNSEATRQAARQVLREQVLCILPGRDLGIVLVIWVS